MHRISRACTLFALFASACPATAGDWRLAANGNVQYDWLQFRSDRIEVPDADGFRRVRFGLTASYGDSLEIKGEYDLQPQAWTDVFLRWKLGDGHALRVGQFKQPIYLDELNSNRVLPMMEQAAPTAFAISRRLGVEYAYAAERWTVAATTFDQNLEGLNEGTGFAVRGTWLPLRTDHGFLHLAAALTTEAPDLGTARFSARPEARLSSVRFVDTGTLADVDRIHRAGAELAWVQGPWMLVSEYITAEARRDAGSFRGDGWYALGSWFPFGQSRGYRNGIIGGPKVAGSGPALELVLRYSHLDLDDGDVAGGQLDSTGAGLTWWISEDIRLMANYLRLDSERGGLSDQPNVLEFRAQLSF